MLKKTIQYIDFTGAEQSEDFYFHLSRRELVLLNLSSNHDDGMVGEWQEIMKQGNGGRIMKVVDQLIVESYGRRTADNQSFVKKPEWTDEFKGSAAYDVLFMNLVTNAAAAAKFFNGIVPAELAKQAQAEAEKLKASETIDSLPVETDEGVVDLGSRETFKKYDTMLQAHGGLIPEPPKSAYDQFIQSGLPFPTKAQLLQFTDEDQMRLAGRMVGAEHIRKEETT